MARTASSHGLGRIPSIPGDHSHQLQTSRPHRHSYIAILRRITVAAAIGSYKWAIRIMEHHIEELAELSRVKENEAKRTSLLREAELEARTTALVQDLAKHNGKRQYTSVSKTIQTLSYPLCVPEMRTL
ncbi:hypothetical protein EVG20_g5043 [Dentipellis fragilis]|uniref:Uncharacterized protein n=1 Tax=Dentipellis fragilis TaxID=205917 RepID=A0A4Y9YUZ4_9AGAM|nr:hypothetical protein EVG20_g5043 [Dentipellis fragilis]